MNDHAEEYVKEMTLGLERFQNQLTDGPAAAWNIESVFWELLAARELAGTKFLPHQDRKKFTRLIKSVWSKSARGYCLLDSNRRILTIEEALKLVDADSDEGFILRKCQEHECSRCKKAFYSPAMEEEIDAEFRNTFGQLRRSDDVVVCHSCYVALRPQFPN